MKLVTFHVHQEPYRAGLLTRHGIVDLAESSYALLPNSPSLPNSILKLLYLEEKGLEQVTQLYELIEQSDSLPVETYQEKSVTLASPVNPPGALLDFYTFEQHVKTCRAKRGLEVIPQWYEYPVYYNGNPRSVIGHQSMVHFPLNEPKKDYELELAIVIGKKGQNISLAEAEDYIAGYMIFNDWSARQIQREVMAVGLGPAKGKDFASSLGPYLVTKNEIKDPRNLTMMARVNGEEWSRGNSGDSHYTFAQMIAFASENVTLYPGDVLGSGTVGTGCGLELDRFLNSGDVVELEIEQLGILRNTVA